MQIRLPPQALWALDQLEAAGFEAYAVGGCVRDSVLGITPQEYDLCSTATPAQVHEVFRGERLIDTGIQHGTVTLLKDGMPLEITTFRADGQYSDGRHPDSVRFSTALVEDLKRRDFTCNAMAYSPLRGLRDHFDGQDACAKKLLKAVGDPQERLSEDALRILRGLRFAATLGFTLEDNTARAMRAMAPGMARLSRERVGAECNRLLLGEAAARVLSEYHDLFRQAVGSGYLLEGEAWGHALRALPLLPAELPLRWAALLRPEGETARACMQGLRQPNALQHGVVHLASHRLDRIDADSLPYQLADWKLAPLLNLLALQRADLLAAIPPRTKAAKEADALMAQAKQLVADGLPLSPTDLAVNGADLLVLGFAPGPALGNALRWLHDEVLAGRLLNQREALLEAAQNRMES